MWIDKTIRWRLQLQFEGWHEGSIKAIQSTRFHIIDNQSSSINQSRSIRGQSQSSGLNQGLWINSNQGNQLNRRVWGLGYWPIAMQIPIGSVWPTNQLIELKVNQVNHNQSITNQLAIRLLWTERFQSELTGCHPSIEFNSLIFPPHVTVFKLAMMFAHDVFLSKCPDCCKQQIQKLPNESNMNLLAAQGSWI